MEKYITLENDFYEILISESLKDYGEEVLKYSTNKLNEYLFFFKKENCGTKIRGSFFLTREDFFDRIKKLSPEANPPSWAQGCFYSEEIQILLNPQNVYERFCTLAHESFHYYFKSLYMQKIIWIE